MNKTTTSTSPDLAVLPPPRCGEESVVWPILAERPCVAGQPCVQLGPGERDRLDFPFQTSAMDVAVHLLPLQLRLIGKHLIAQARGFDEI